MKWYKTSINEFLEKFETEDSKYWDDLYNIYYDLSTAIFKYRMSENISQAELGARLGVNRAKVSLYESGDYNFTMEELYNICKKLGFNLQIKIGHQL